MLCLANKAPFPTAMLQMGLHVFFGCYHNLFRLMAKCGVLENLLLKEHTHTFCNNDGDVRELDFRFDIGGQKIGAPFHGEEGECWKRYGFQSHVGVTADNVM